MTPETIVRIPDHVVSRDMDGETVLLNLNSGTYFGLDEVGARIWTLLGQGLPLAAVSDQIGGEYDAPRETVESDVEELCAELAENDLIVEVV